MYNTESFSSPYCSSGSNSIPRHPDLPYHSYLQNMYMFFPFFFGHAVTCPAAATTHLSPPARFYEPDLNPVAGSCFAGSARCQEFLGRRSECNLDAQGNVQGVRGTCYSQGSSQRNNPFPSAAKILFFSPYRNAHSHRWKCNNQFNVNPTIKNFYK